MPTLLVVVGVGRLGGAIVQGLRRTRALSPRDLMLVDPTAEGVAPEAVGGGAVKAVSRGLKGAAGGWLGGFAG